MNELGPTYLSMDPTAGDPPQSAKPPTYLSMDPLAGEPVTRPTPRPLPPQAPGSSLRPTTLIPNRQPLPTLRQIATQQPAPRMRNTAGGTQRELERQGAPKVDYATYRQQAEMEALTRDPLSFRPGPMDPLAQGALTAGGGVVKAAGGEYAAGANDILEGAFQAASVALPAAVLTAPLTTAVMVTLAGRAGEAATTAAKWMGLSDEQARLAGNAAMLSVGVVGAKRIAKGIGQAETEAEAIGRWMGERFRALRDRNVIETTGGVVGEQAVRELPMTALARRASEGVDGPLSRMGTPAGATALPRGVPAEGGGQVGVTQPAVPGAAEGAETGGLRGAVRQAPPQVPDIVGLATTHNLPPDTVSTILKFDPHSRRRPTQGEMRQLRDQGLATEAPDHSFMLTDQGRVVLYDWYRQQATALRGEVREAADVAAPAPRTAEAADQFVQQFLGKGQPQPVPSVLDTSRPLDWGPKPTDPMRFYRAEGAPSETPDLGPQGSLSVREVGGDPAAVGANPPATREPANVWIGPGAPEPWQAIAHALAADARIPSVGIDVHQTGITFIERSGDRIPFTIGPTPKALVSEVIESLCAQFRVDNLTQLDIEGQTIPAPQDPAAWHALTPVQRDTILKKYELVGIYDGDTDTGHIGETYAHDLATWLHERGHAGVRRMMKAERIAAGVETAAKEEEAIYRGWQPPAHVWDRPLDSLRQRAQTTAIDASRQTGLPQSAAVPGGAQPSAPEGATVRGGSDTGVDAVPAYQEANSTLRFAVRVSDVSRHANGIHVAHGQITRGTGSGLDVDITYTDRDFSQFGSPAHDQRSVDLWLKVLNAVPDEERANTLSLSFGHNKLQNQPVMNASVGCGRDAATLAAIDAGVLPADAALDMVSCHGDACYKNTDNHAMTAGSPFSVLIAQARIDLAKGKRTTKAVRDFKQIARRLSFQISDEDILSRRDDKGERKGDTATLTKLKYRFNSAALPEKTAIREFVKRQGWERTWRPQEATTAVVATPEQAASFVHGLKDGTIQTIIKSPAPFVRGNQQGDWLNEILTGTWQAMVRALMARGVTPKAGKRFTAVTTAWYQDVPFELLQQIAKEFGPAGEDALVLQVTGPIDFPYDEAILRLKGHDKMRRAGLAPVLRLITDEFGMGGPRMNDPTTIQMVLQYILDTHLRPADILETPLHFDSSLFSSSTKSDPESVDRLAASVRRNIFDYPPEEAERSARAILAKNNVFLREGPHEEKWGHNEVRLTYQRLWDLGVMTAKMERALKAAGFLQPFKRGDAREPVEGVFKAVCCTTGKCLTCGATCQALLKKVERRNQPGTVSTALGKIIRMVDVTNAAVATHTARTGKGEM
jgi:hypothetical protein